MESAWTGAFVRQEMVPLSGSGSEAKLMMG